MGVEVIECVEVMVELGKGGSEGEDECRRNAGVGDRAHVVQYTGGAGVWGRRWCVREGGRLKVDHHGFVIREFEVRVMQDGAAGDEVKVAECKDDVVDDSGR